MGLLKLSDFTEIIMGQSPKGSSYNENGEGYPLLNGAADYKGQIFKPKKFTNQPTRLVKEGDILLGIRATIGNFAFADREYCIGRGVAGIRVNDELADKKYIKRIVENELNKIIHTASGSTIKGIKKEDLTDMLISLPPLKTQKKIAAILDEADKLRQLDKQLIEKYDELTQSLFLDMFGDPFSGKTEVLKDNINILGGYAFKSKDFVKEGIPLIKIGTVNKGYFDINNLSFLPISYLNDYKKWIVYPGDILMSLTGTVGKDDYGNVEIASSDYENYFLNQRVAKIEPRNNKYLKDFLFGMFSNSKTKKELTKLSRGVRQANISNRDIEGLKMIIPSIELQEKYVSSIRLIEAQKALAQQSLEKSEELFNSLLQKAFKGELV